MITRFQPSRKKRTERQRKFTKMNLQEFINKKHTHYLIGYIEDDEFWSVNECGSLKSAFEMIEHHKILSKTKRDYIIVEKQITYSQVKV